MRVSTVSRLLGAAVVLGAFAAAAEPREPKAESTPRASGVPSADLPRRAPGLTLYFFDVHNQLDGQFCELAAETSAIFREMGVELTWRQGGLGTTYGNSGAPEIPIIVLDTPPKGVANGANVLGLVPRNTAGSKAIWIFVDNLRSTLGSTLDTPRGLGLAAGRVVAHEVVHTLAPDLPHTKDGLMRHALSRTALTEPVRPLQDRYVSAVQAALGIAPRNAPALTTESGLFFRPPIF